jgi:GYF domain 2
MESYYFHDGLDKRGPFTLAEFKNQHLKRDTPVWKEGMQDWARAADLPELQVVFPVTPPLFKGGAEAKSGGNKVGRSATGVGIVALILIVGLLVFARNRQIPPNFQYTPAPVVDPERANPVGYLSAGGTYRFNFWHTKWDISGVISNLATHTNYKDVIVKVNFYSATNTVIASEQYIVYDYFAYGLKKGFTLEVNHPAAAAACGWVPVGATVY